MNADQLLEQIRINRLLMAERQQHALEHFDMLVNTYPHLVNDEIALNIELCYAMIELNYKSNYVGALDRAIAALEKYKHVDAKDIVAYQMKLIGHCYAHTGEFDLANRYLMDSLDALEPEHPNYIMHKTDVLHALAMAEEFRNEGSEMIIPYLEQAIALLQHDKYKVRKANCLMGVGNVQINKDQVMEALANYTEAVETFENAYALDNMASAYSNIGNCYIKLEDFAEAEKYHEKALQLRLQFSSPDHVCISYYNLGVLYKARKEFDRAEEQFLKTLKIVEEVGNKPFIEQINEEMDDLLRLRNAANETNA